MPANNHDPPQHTTNHTYLYCHVPPFPTTHGKHNEGIRLRSCRLGIPLPTFLAPLWNCVPCKWLSTPNNSQMDPGGFRTPKQKEQEQDKKNTTPSATALFFCSVLYNTTLQSYRLPQLWCAIHVVPGQQRGNAKRTATTSTGCFLLNFSNGSCWQRGREREASSASSASSATKTQTRRIKKSKEKKTHSLTCNPFNRGCIFDRQAMTLATKASFVDQDLTRHTRMQTQNTKKYNTATSVLPNPRGPLPYISPPTIYVPVNRRSNQQRPLRHVHLLLIFYEWFGDLAILVFLSFQHLHDHTKSTTRRKKISTPPRNQRNPQHLVETYPKQPYPFHECQPQWHHA